MSKSELHSQECTCGACAPSAQRRRHADALRIALTVFTLVSLVLAAVAARLQLDALSTWN